MKTLHYEKQQFLPFGVRIFVLIFSMGLLVLAYMDLLEYESNYFLLSFLGLTVLVILLNLLFWKLYLYLKITSYDVRYRYPPFINNWRIIPRESIEYYKTEPYNAAKFGGWGIRFNFTGKGWAYTVFNKHVLAIQPFNKKKIRIGTHKKKSVELAMSKMMKREDG